MAEAGVAARKAAVAMLDGVLGDGAALSELVGERGPLARLDDPSERARAQRLATQTLRHLGQADRLLKPHLRKSPALTVKNALRLKWLKPKARIFVFYRDLRTYGLMETMVGVTAYGDTWGRALPHLGMVLVWDVAIFGAGLWVVKRKVESL